MEYINHLSKDKKLKAILFKQQPLRLVKRKNIHLHLCGSIMSQQLSTRVADTFRKRFLTLYGGKGPSPNQILKTSVETLRAIGLSFAKASYIHNVARFALEEGFEYKRLNKMSDEQVVEYLTRIKGVGKWTAEMILMFTLGREDIFAVDDLGIQQSMKSLYRLDHSNKKKFRENLLAISRKWSPYRTYACLHLWRWKDKVPSKEPA
jgi:DNA-3-methyladenine glycosylase II